MPPKDTRWQDLTWSWAYSTGHPASDLILGAAAQAAWPYAVLCAWTYPNDRDAAHDLMDHAGQNASDYLGRHPGAPAVEQFEDFAEHEASESEVMEGGEGLREALIASGQPSEARGLSEASLDHPEAWQQDEAAFGFGVLHHFQLDAVPGRGALSGVSR